MQQQLATRLSVEQQQLIETKVANERKSVGLAYVLWFFLGLWGIHNFYLGKPKLALFQLLGGVVALILIFISGAAGPAGAGSTGAIALFILVVWGLSFIVDLFLIPGRASAYSERLRQRYAADFSGS